MPAMAAVLFLSLPPLALARGGSDEFKPLNLVLFLLVGLAAGWLAGLLMKGRGFGILGNMVIGVVGAVIGGFLFSLAGLKAAGLGGAFVMSVVGAVILLGIAGYISRR